MASLRDFGLAPDPRDERRRTPRQFHHPDESGARRLPNETDAETVARYRAYEARQRADAEALDEDVELPGVSRRGAGLLFGIGAGIGIAVLAVAGGLYLSGYVGRPVLNAAPEPTPLSEGAAQREFEDAQNARALELARIAPVLIEERNASPTPTQLNSPDIRVIDEAAPAPSATPSAPTEPAQTSSDAADSSSLSGELEELRRSVQPHGGPVAPQREPSNSSSAPEPSVPPPAEPTAPAETSPPDSTNPY